MTNVEIAASHERRFGGDFGSRKARDPAGGGRFERAFHRAMYLGIQRLRGRPVGRWMQHLVSWDALDEARYAALARQRLETVLELASAGVPLYRSCAWRKHIASDPRDIARWPLLDRADLIERKNELLAYGAVPALLLARRSSASTGRPVEVLWDRHAVAWSWAAEYHPMLWHGLEIGTRTLRLWGSASLIENFVLNRHFVPADALTPARLEAAVRYLDAFRPQLVWGTPSAVHELARYIGRTGRAEDAFRVPYVKVGGEQLYRFQRDEIVRHLGERLIESYGCTEMGPIAAECPAGSLHVLATNVHVEIFRDGAPARPGEFGEIVATNLVNRAMPLVRYRIGDLGALSPSPCRCGRPQPVLAALRGRAADLVTKTDGTRIHGSILGDALQRCPSDSPLGSAQKVLFEQLDRQRWKVRLEFHRRPDSAALERQVGDLLRDVLGPGCQTEIEIVARIAREPSGKFRYYKVRGGPSRPPESADRPTLH
ncbi:MAG: hypothetical protein C0P79_011915 [Gammaproteobacteria bacterium]